jgi:hypothetical protein
METPSRRETLQLGALLGTGAALLAISEAQAEEPKKKTDRDFVMEAGMTEAEAECWELIAKAAGKFFELPKLHPTDASEVATAIHVIQNKLLARPTYRKYLEIAKKALGQPPSAPK